MIDSWMRRMNISEGFYPIIGLCRTDKNGKISTLVDRAQESVREIKGKYGKRINLYDEEMVVRRDSIEMMLLGAHDALREGEFMFYLQPKVDLDTREIISVEALARWEHGGDIIEAQEFIPNMADSGFLFALDRFIWEEVFKWMKKRMDENGALVPVSLKIAPLDFYFMDVPSFFESMLERCHIPRELIEIEFSEKALENSSDAMSRGMKRFEDTGYKLVVSDFGNGYMSANSLGRLLPYELKMDRKYFHLYSDDEWDSAIPKEILQFSEGRGVHVVAERIETEEELNQWKSIGCRYGQGYYLYRPMPPAELGRILDEMRR